MKMCWAEPLGDASYPLYLTHPVVVATARMLSQKGVLAPAATRWSYLVGVVLASIALSMAVHRFVEVPLTEKARRALSLGATRHRFATR
jgi:peptidoglycan/LPS O-acetylase OafA/YrhL